jgi:hypothetical protein
MKVLTSFHTHCHKFWDLLDFAGSPAAFPGSFFVRKSSALLLCLKVRSSRYQCLRIAKTGKGIHHGDDDGGRWGFPSFAYISVFVLPHMFS